MIVATRYAKSLLQLAIEQGKLEQTYADMQLVKSVYEGNREFVNFLNSPIISTDKKIAVLSSIFEGKISEITSGFFRVLSTKRREMYIGDIAKAFIAQYKQHKGITTAVVTSAAGIDSNARAAILDLVKKQSKGEVELVEKTDRSLIGGFILRIGDKQVDASISRKLNELRKTFEEDPHSININ